MIRLARVAVVVFLASNASLASAQKVQEIPGNWESADLCRLAVVGAKASSALTPEGQQYAVSRAIDGQRGTKWVANIAPSQAAPQWITLELAVTQAVSAVAVFGERVDNDGILDAELQVAGSKPDEFIAGSPTLRRAMAAIRRGAGQEAWVRYCQTPPLVSVGLANSAYIGDDTGDAGLANWMNLERVNAPLLAASYWVNDRLYHREVCDMSVGMNAGVEEARFKMSLMTMSGCSVSFSDDFRALELPRIRMMQQCLPPGNPLARPLDLFERERPSLWHMHCKNAAGEWDAVGLFNFEDQPQERTVELADLGLPADAEVTVFEFWEEQFLGTHRHRVTVPMAPATARILLIHRRPDRPTVIGTNMHVLGGYHEIRQLAWDEESCTLTGHCRRMPGVHGCLYLYVPEGFQPRIDPASPLASTPTHVGGPLWSVELVFDDIEETFRIAFQRGGT